MEMRAPWLLILGLLCLSATPAVANVNPSHCASLTSGGTGYPPK